MFIPRRRVGILQRERESAAAGAHDRTNKRGQEHIFCCERRPLPPRTERASEAMFWWGLKLAMSDATSTRRKPLIYYSGIVLPWQDFRTDSEYLAPKIQIRACVLYFLCVCLFVVTRARARARTTSTGMMTMMKS